MSTFITRLEAAGTGPRLAVKDLIDVAGTPTTAGCRAVADTAEPAVEDAECMAGARAAGARIVGKTNLTELAMTASRDESLVRHTRQPARSGTAPGWFVERFGGRGRCR